MNQELLQKLREAGYPIDTQWCTYHGTGPVMDVAICICKEPTLEDLIEWLGEDIKTIDFLHGLNMTVAYSADSIGKMGKGITPLEAVINLALALHTKEGK